MRILEQVVSRPYDVVIHNEFTTLKERIKACSNPSSICIVTDTNVAPYYLEEIQTICSEIATTFSHVFKAGEASKHMGTISQIYDSLLACNVDRKGLIVALGGGVVGDMAGFVAATYMRGISFVQVPTTTVAQNDSSIGGKTGVDYKAHKNMVGAFYNPLLVYINTTTLKTLPQKEIIGGLAEVIKHGLIQDQDLISYMKKQREAILCVEEEALEEMTYASCKVKCSVIEEDMKELGLRKILNFGHTIGHAIETLSHFELSHGESVAYGSCMAAYMSYKRQLIDKKDLEKIIELFKIYGLLQPIRHFEGEEVWEHMAYDKKMAYGKVSFILLEAIGKACSVRDINKDEVLEAIQFIEKTCS